MIRKGRRCAGAVVTGSRPASRPAQQWVSSPVESRRQRNGTRWCRLRNDNGAYRTAEFLTLWPAVKTRRHEQPGSRPAAPSRGSPFQVSSWPGPSSTDRRRRWYVVPRRPTTLAVSALTGSGRRRRTGARPPGRRLQAGKAIRGLTRRGPPVPDDNRPVTRMNQRRDFSEGSRRFHDPPHPAPAVPGDRCEWSVPHRSPGAVVIRHGAARSRQSASPPVTSNAVGRPFSGATVDPRSRFAPWHRAMGSAGTTSRSVNWKEISGPRQRRRRNAGQAAMCRASSDCVPRLTPAVQRGRSTPCAGRPRASGRTAGWHRHERLNAPVGQYAAGIPLLFVQKPPGTRFAGKQASVEAVPWPAGASLLGQPARGRTRRTGVAAWKEQQLAASNQLRKFRWPPRRARPGRSPTLPEKRPKTAGGEDRRRQSEASSQPAIEMPVPVSAGCRPEGGAVLIKGCSRG